jgi:hypothetical protein
MVDGCCSVLKAVRCEMQSENFAALSSRWKQFLKAHNLSSSYLPTVVHIPYPGRDNLEGGVEMRESTMPIDIKEL